ncbi:MAG: glycosyltransferase family 4 protein, partial [Candidatus Eisenbacteria sp.]|nr:glycosyltransferase family 4 protein [Candidatus Eisenbacteria bacterium]
GIVTPTYHPYPGGVPEHVYHTCVELGRMGHNVRVVTTHFGRGRAPNEEQVLRIGRSVPVPANGSICPVAVDVRMRAKVRRMLLAERFDVLHLHEPLMPTLCLSVLAEAEVPIVGTFHANNDSALGYRLFHSLLENYLDRLDARIAVSSAAMRTVAKRFGGDYIVIPNGVDVGRFSIATPASSQDDGVFNILFVGRLEPRKGAKFLLRAMPRILREVPEARLVVVGSGPLSRYYRSHLPDNVADRVVFAGRVSGEALASHYAGADVFCSPAMGGESFGIVLIEAMAAGAAVVASDIAGYRDVVSDGATGLLVRRGDPDSIAEGVVRLARDDELRRRLVESARSEVRQYAWDRVTRRILDVYESVVDGGAAQSGERGEPIVEAEQSEEGVKIEIG